MNKLLIYSFIIIAAAATVAFGLIAGGIFMHTPIIGNNVSPKGVNAIVVKPLEIYVKSISANKTNETNDKFGIIFNVHNPNQSTMLLDGIHYNVYSRNLAIISGDIGTEAQLDVVRGQTSFPILGNSTITLKDVNILHRTNSISGIWDEIVDGKAIYAIKGTYSTKEAANLNYSPGFLEFNSTYP
jgi:LEA14-like dessication related protein